MDAHWLYELDGQVHGPITPEELFRLARAGVIQPHHRVRKTYKPNWLLAAKVRGLYSTPGAPAAEGDDANPFAFSSNFGPSQPIGGGEENPFDFGGVAPAVPSPTKPVPQAKLHTPAPPRPAPAPPLPSPVPDTDNPFAFVAPEGPPAEANPFDFANFGSPQPAPEVVKFPTPPPPPPAPSAPLPARPVKLHKSAHPVRPSPPPAAAPVAPENPFAFEPPVATGAELHPSPAPPMPAPNAPPRTVPTPQRPKPATSHPPMEAPIPVGRLEPAAPVIASPFAFDAPPTVNPLAFPSPEPAPVAAAPIADAAPIPAPRAVEPPHVAPADHAEPLSVTGRTAELLPDDTVTLIEGKTTLQLDRHWIRARIELPGKIVRTTYMPVHRIEMAMIDRRPEAGGKGVATPLVPVLGFIAGMQQIAIAFKGDEGPFRAFLETALSQS